MIDIRYQLNRIIQGARRYTPRRFQAYCIGAPKTGTTSVASMFSPVYRSRHEPEPEHTIKTVLKYLKGRCSRSDVKTAMRERDRRLWLELESFHILAYVSDVIHEIFPNALFLVTVRDPLNWLDSRLNYHYKLKRDGTAWEKYRDYFWFRNHNEYPTEEKILKKYDLCQIDAYLEKYSDHYRRVFSSISDDRRIIIKTEDIDNKTSEISDFLGVTDKSINTSHKNKQSDKISFISQIDDGYLRRRIHDKCSKIASMFS
jgi:hypothetical protein